MGWVLSRNIKGPAGDAGSGGDPGAQGSQGASVLPQAIYSCAVDDPGDPAGIYLDNGVFDVINLWSVVASNGITFNGDDTWTIVTAGLYWIYGKMAIQIINGTGQRMQRLYINGAVADESATPASTAAYAHLPINWTGRLYAGDTIQTAVMQSSGTSGNYLAPNGQYCHLGIVRMAA